MRAWRLRTSTSSSRATSTSTTPEASPSATPSGRLRPRFPRAQYIVRRGEWEDATHVHSQNTARYQPDNYRPLAEAGVLQLVDDDVTIMPGVRVKRTGGHSTHHQVVMIESGGKSAAFAADLIPTTGHVTESWIPALDLYPMDTLAAKRAFNEDAMAREVLVFFYHDPVHRGGLHPRRRREPPGYTGELHSRWNR